MKRDAGELDAALADLNECLDYWKARNHPRWMANTLRQIASVYYKQKKIVEAKDSLASARDLYKVADDRIGGQSCFLNDLFTEPALIEDYF